MTESSLTIRTNDSPQASQLQKRSWYLTGEVGYMLNLSGSSAVGATGLAGFDDNGSRLAIKARYRQWLSRTGVSLEVSPGIILSATDNYFETRVPGFTGHAGVNLWVWLAVIAMVETLPLRPLPQFPESEDPGTDVAWYLGGKLGSYAGFIGALVVGVAALIASATVDTGFN